MTAARRFSPAARARAATLRNERVAALYRGYGFAALRPARVVPLEEQVFIAIGDPRLLRAPDRIVDGVMVSTEETCVMRLRAFVLRVKLARKLARMAEHEGLAATWRGTARENLYQVRLYVRALRQLRGER